MKLNPEQNEKGPKCLSRKQLRTIERDLGVYLDKPENVSRTSNQQFGVYDENEVHAGDIIADDRYFTEPELISSIKVLFSLHR